MEEKRNIVGDYIWAFVATGWSTGLNLVVYYFLTRRLGEVGFSEYMVGRRAVSLIIVVAMVGTAVSLPRYMAFHKSEKTDAKEYLYAACLLLLPGTAILSILLIFFPLEAAHVLYGEAKQQELVIPLLLFFWSLIISAIIFAFLRGQMEFGKANFFSSVCAASIPISLFTSSSSSRLFFTAAIVQGAINTAFLPHVILSAKSRIRKSHVIKKVRALLKYGYPRVPGDFALEAFFLVPLLFANHLYSLSIGGFIAFGFAFLALTNSLLSPISIVLLPRAASILSSSGYSGARKEIKNLVLLTVFVTAFITVVSFFLAEPIVSAYLGVEDTTGVLALRIIIVSVIPYGLYSTLRSVIDAAEVRPVNAHNLYVAFTAFFLVAALGQLVAPENVTLFLASLPVGFSVLGLKSVISIRKIAKRLPVREAR